MRCLITYLSVVLVITSGSGIYSGNTLYHNQSRTDYSHLPSLHDCEVGNKVGLLFTANKELHIFLDGKHVTKLSTGLPRSLCLEQLMCVTDVPRSSLRY